MKQYFVYKNPSNAAEGHIEISGAAFYKLTAENNLLPKSEQRFFAVYNPHDGKDQYMAYFETSRRGKNAMESADRNFQKYDVSLFGDSVVSLDDAQEDVPPIDCADSSCDAQVSVMVESICFMEQVSRLVSGSQEWGDMVSMYAQGRKRDCVSILARKYGTCAKTMYNRREQFENTLKEFAKDWT